MRVVLAICIAIGTGASPIRAQEKPEALVALTTVLQEATLGYGRPVLLAAIRHESGSARHDSATLATLGRFVSGIVDKNAGKVVDTTVISISKAGPVIRGEYLITIEVGSARKCPKGSGLSHGSVRTTYSVRCADGRCVPLVKNKVAGAGGC